MTALLVAVITVTAGLRAGMAGSAPQAAAHSSAHSVGPVSAHGQLTQLLEAPVVRGLPSAAAATGPTLPAFAQRIDVAPIVAIASPPPRRPIDRRRAARRARSSGHVPHLGPDEAS